METLPKILADYQAALANERSAVRRLIVARDRLMTALSAEDGRVQLLVNFAALAFSLRPEYILSHRRDGWFPVARWAIMKALREDHKLSTTEIGQMLGGMDHGTVINGLHRLANRYQFDPAARSRIDMFNHLRVQPAAGLAEAGSERKVA